MKRHLIPALFLMAGMAVAQQGPGMTPFAADPAADASYVTEGLYSVSRSDLYCSGFVTKQKISKDSFVAGGLNSPYATRFVDRDLIFIQGKYEVGTRVSMVRELRNPDDFEIYPGTDKMLAEAGQPYADLGYARVIEIRNGMAIAKIEFACETIVPGDQVVPFVDRPQVVARATSTLKRFPGEPASLTGNIAMIRDFDQYAVAGKKVYLNIGREKGVKSGEYFSITRSYSPRSTDIADAGSFSSVPVEDTQKKPPHLPDGRFKDFPRRLVGEIIILDVTQTSATGMVTFSLEEMHAGDAAELETPQAPAGTRAGTE